jgi:hypothetical protein
MQAYGTVEAQFHSFTSAVDAEVISFMPWPLYPLGKSTSTTEEVARWAPRTLIDGFENRKISFIRIFHCVFSNNNEVEKTTNLYIYIYIYINPLY